MHDWQWEGGEREGRHEWRGQQKEKDEKEEKDKRESARMRKRKRKARIMMSRKRFHISQTWRGKETEQIQWQDNGWEAKRSRKLTRAWGKKWGRRTRAGCHWRKWPRKSMLQGQGAPTPSADSATQHSLLALDFVVSTSVFTSLYFCLCLILHGLCDCAIAQQWIQAIKEPGNWTSLTL